ncbi:MAG: hypothetical protein HMLKMBBP_00888 [Planctomycetes bacterium]|nr:hypothetical protein [Planctomycetota bacterium]
MSPRGLLFVAALAAAATLAAPHGVSAQQRFGTVTAVQAPKGQSIRSAFLADIDGDGADDLVVATRRGGKRPSRSVRVHLRRSGEATFDPEPDATYDLTPDVCAIGAGDVDPTRAGCEVVLFTSQAVHAWLPRPGEDAEVGKLFDASFLWQMPDTRDVLVWQGSFSDVDGDGRTDLVLPEPDRYRIALQRPAAAPEPGRGGASWLPVSVLRVPEDEVGEDTESAGARRLRARAERRRLRVQIAIGEGGDAPTDLVDVTESVPAPQILDFDGDGRRDVLAQTASALHVWRQKADGTFPEQPDSTWPLPVVADRSRRLDVSYSAHAAEFSGDGRADCVFLAGDARSESTRTQILVFVQGAPGPSPLFGGKGEPTGLMVVSGFAGGARLSDVDGDGLPDLSLGVVNIDGLDALAAAAKGTLDTELLVWRNRRGRFERAPDLRWVVPMRGESLRNAKGESVVARFVADATGDGVRDLLVRDQPSHLALRMVRRQGESLSVVERPLWETVLSDGATVHVHEPAGRKPPEVLIVEDGMVRHVRWP